MFVQEHFLGIKQYLVFLLGDVVDRGSCGCFYRHNSKYLVLEAALFEQTKLFYKEQFFSIN